MTEKTEQIARLRERIDAVDDQLVALLVERASLAVSYTHLRAHET